MKSADEIKDIVKTKYGEIARQGGTCCGPTGCCDTLGGTSFAENYQGWTGIFPRRTWGSAAVFPTEYAGIEEGQTVIDLGSGAGNDVFVVRAIVVGQAGSSAWTWCPTWWPRPRPTPPSWTTTTWSSTWVRSRTCLWMTASPMSWSATVS